MRLVLALLLLALQRCAGATDQPALQPASTCNGLFFATLNIQNYGVSKASKTAVMDALASTIARYDIVGIQELSQKPSGDGVCGPNTMSAICDLLAKVRDLTKRDYALAVSPRIGDEQYTMLYDASRAVFKDGATYPDVKQIHSRPPHAFRFSIGAATFVVALTHTSPDKATEEIQNFPDVMSWMTTTLGGTYQVIAGDFNADGSYFKEDTLWEPILKQMPGYSLRTSNELDTTVAASSNTYDRIIATESLSADAPAVFVWENHMDMRPIMTQGCAGNAYINADVCDSATTDWAKIALEISDHYPVEMCMHITPKQDLVPATPCLGRLFATFNIQNFGETKASRSAVLHALATTIARYDIVAIQELSQKPDGKDVCGPNTMSAICDLLAKVKEVSKRSFAVAASPRIGDEQYTVLYDSTRALFTKAATYPDINNKHTRPPHAFQFSFGSQSLVVAVAHTQASTATVEIANFPDVISWMSTTFKSDFRMLVGDFNADGSYFKEDSAWKDVLAQMPGYVLQTGNELDTTVSSSSHTYDRIIGNFEPKTAPEVFMIEKHVDLTDVMKQGCIDGYVSGDVCGESSPDWSLITRALSDRYPVELCLQLSAIGSADSAVSSSRLQATSPIIALILSVILSCAI